MCKIFTFSFAKKSIPYSQALRIKRFCSTFDEYKKHSNDLAKQIVGKGYKDLVSKPNGRSRQSREIQFCQTKLIQYGKA